MVMVVAIRYGFPPFWFHRPYTTDAFTILDSMKDAYLPWFHNLKLDISLELDQNQKPCMKGFHPLVCSLRLNPAKRSRNVGFG